MLLEQSFGMVYDDPVEVTVWFSAVQARYIQERQWAKERKITKRKDGSIVLWMKASGWYDVKKWILPFGAEAELLDTEALRRDIMGDLSVTLLRYGLTANVLEG